MAKICLVCHKLLKAKVISYEGRKFCCMVCCGKYKRNSAHKTKKVCEFC